MDGLNNLLSNRGHLRLLLHWRWLVLAIAIPISLVIELFEGETRGLHFLDEIIIDGLVLPVTTWVVLTFAARNIARQYEREEQLERRQRLTQQLTEHREYNDLSAFLVRFPATLLPVEHTALYIYDQESGRLDFVTQWGGEGSGAQHPPAPRCCAETLAATDARAQRQICAATLTQAGNGGAPGYCLLLRHEATPVGILRLKFQPNKQPKPEQIELLTALAPEIALGLTLAIEASEQAEQAYREAQVHERRRITQELHDTLAQQVFYLHLSLDQLSDEATLENQALRRKVESLRDVAADVYDQIRNNLSILRTWEQVDLTEAIIELARVTAHNHGLAIDVRVAGEAGWLSPHTCEHVYSIVREALNNVVKHAKARQLKLDLTWTAERLIVGLRDDGIGFSPAQRQSDGHFGLTLMREAVDALEGELTLESSVGHGTRLQVDIPLQLTQPAARQRKAAALEPESSYIAS
jgi:signal transduction histidine kinase